MSRLAALKEFSFMKALKGNGFVVPEPIAHNRHTIVMELIDAFPLRQISEVPDPAGLYAELMEMILRLAQYGLIHGDFNEFNILIREDEAPQEQGKGNKIPPTDPKDAKPQEAVPSIRLTPVLIDFPQMVSIDHANAEMYFDRDVNCIKRFFERRFHFTSDEPGPFFADAEQRVRSNEAKRLDVEVEASGFSRKMAKELEKYMREAGVDGDGGNDRETYRSLNQDSGDEDEVEEEADNAPFEQKSFDEIKNTDKAAEPTSISNEPSLPLPSLSCSVLMHQLT